MLVLQLPRARFALDYLKLLFKTMELSMEKQNLAIDLFVCEQVHAISCLHQLLPTYLKLGQELILT